jgi:hypothetical protein
MKVMRRVMTFYAKTCGCGVQVNLKGEWDGHTNKIFEIVGVSNSNYSRIQQLGISLVSILCVQIKFCISTKKNAGMHHIAGYRGRVDVGGKLHSRHKICPECDHLNVLEVQ